MNDLAGTVLNGAAATSPVVQQLGSMLRLTPVEGGFRASLHVDMSLSILRDHFRDRPILPGVCLVQAVLLGVAGCRSGATARLCELKHAKFFHAAVPGDQVDIDAQMVNQPDGTVNVNAKVTVEGRRLAQVSLVAGIRGADQAEGWPAESGA